MKKFSELNENIIDRLNNFTNIIINNKKDIELVNNKKDVEKYKNHKYNTNYCSWKTDFIMSIILLLFFIIILYQFYLEFIKVKNNKKLISIFLVFFI